MNVLIAGASGMIGTSLIRELRRAGHAVFRLTRDAAVEADAVPWNPSAGVVTSAAVARADAIVNLAGENIAAGRWNAARRQRIRQSRIDATKTLVEALRTAPSRPRVFVNASAVGIYGDRGNEIVTEASPLGQGFLPEVCTAWEAEAVRAGDHGARVVRLRFGVVLSEKGGALAKMMPFFRLGLGGPLGSGAQWMSWISLTDAVAAIAYGLAEVRCEGALNVVAPEPVTNAVFTRALAGRSRRPALLRVPGFALRWRFGQMADDSLLASTRALPSKLQAVDFPFAHPKLDSALAAEIPPD